jgi:hypothetical protein
MEGRDDELARLRRIRDLARDAMREAWDAGAVVNAIKVGIDEAVYRCQSEWRGWFGGVDLYRLKCACEREVWALILKKMEGRP